MATEGAGRGRWRAARWLAAAAAAIVAAVVLLARSDGVPRGADDGGDDAVAVAPPATAAPDGGGVPGGASAGPTGDGQPRTPDEAEFARDLRRRFGRTIGHAHTQVRAIETVRSYLQHVHGDDWRRRLYDVLRAAFPERADELYALLRRLERWEEWLREGHAELAQLPVRERRAALWAKRYEVFGDDADEIWEVVRRSEHVLDALEAIRETPPPTLQEKLDRYLGAVREAWGDQADGVVARRQTELMTRFLSVDVVQDDLRALSPEARDQELGRIRSALGMDAQALARWQALDAERDRAWATGERYLAERASIEAAYQGDERRARVTALQDRLFGAEAGVVRAEEESGFQRFAHPRRFGRE